MKRYMEAKEIQILYFTAYFLHGRSKYGSAERGDIRLARIGACRGVMRVCRTLTEAPQPVLRSHLDEAFILLQRQAERLTGGAFKTAYLETLAFLQKTV